ncbi:hypothetical protein BLA24_28110 [Streptomyces cinnamoneus]|uniref:Anticodon-binding domain-containing protein n=1 Tax=Streptomyces cinnamoneus TaxID=53446 RepID=A0A2G1XC26_STRCJ|nr:hypothetical protein BLA24_28110 [Streptomyces cinnamoneus]
MTAWYGHQAGRADPRAQGAVLRAPGLRAQPLSTHRVEARVGEAEEFVRRCVERGLRAEARGPEHGTLGARVRSARLVPYQAVIGPREATDGLVALRLRDGRRLDPLPAGEALGRIKGVVVSRRGELWGEEGGVNGGAGGAGAPGGCPYGFRQPVGAGW